MKTHKINFSIHTKNAKYKLCLLIFQVWFHNTGATNCYECLINTLVSKLDFWDKILVCVFVGVFCGFLFKFH